MKSMTPEAKEQLRKTKVKWNPTQYPGVLFIESAAHSPNGKPVKTFYVRGRVKSTGKPFFEKAERTGHPVVKTATEANAIRSKLIAGTILPNKERRKVEAAAEQAEESRWTLDRLWERWQADPENAGKRGTFKADQRWRKHISADPDDVKTRTKDAPPPLGDREPQDLKPLDIDRLRLYLAKDHAKATVISVIGLIRRAANYGASRELCPGLSFPISLRGKTLGREPRVRRVPTPEEMAKYIETCRSWPDPQAANFQLLIAYTGIRRSSAQRLTWADLDLDNQTALLRDSKTGDVQIVLSDEAVAVLRNHPRVTGKDGKEIEYVFVGKNRAGEYGPRTQREIDRIPAQIRDAAGLPADLDPCHSFRRNLATQLDAEGVSTLTIMRLGGWKSPAMVANYTKTTGQTLREAANLLGRKIAGAKNGEQAG